MTHEWRKTMLGWQYHVDGEVCGWVVALDYAYQAQILVAGQTKTIGVYLDENQAKAAVMAAQEDNMTRNTAHEDQGLDLQEGEPMDEEPREEIEEYLDKIVEDESDPEPAPEPAPRQRRKRSDAGKPRGPRKPKPAVAAAPPPAKAKRGRKAKTKPLDAVDPDLLAVAEYIAKRDALRCERDNLNVQIDELMDSLSERQLAIVEAVEKVGT